MSGLELNKIAASILLAGLIAMLVGFITDVLYKPDSNPKVRGYSVAVTEDTKENVMAVEEFKPDIALLMKEADHVAGAELFKKCLSCHTIDKGGINGVGPNLWNIVGNKKAAHDGYRYSEALTKLGGNWDYENLFSFLHKPQKHVPGTKMSFVGLNKPTDIANIIEFLRSHADSPYPLP